MQVINQAKQAEELKKNPLLNGIMVALKAECFERFAKLERGDNFENEAKKVHDLMEVVARFERHIESCINKGKVAEFNATENNRKL